MADKIERELNALRRLPENRICGTCRVEDRFGHKAVCMKFRIFVCSECKSAHQAFSHKCKSVTMSNWTQEEVDELKAPCGGNAANFASTFAKLDPAADTWPTGCKDPDEVKVFVRKAYEDKRWQVEAPRSRAVSAPLAAPPAACTPPAVVQSKTAPIPKTATAVEFDLLGSLLDAPASAPVPDAGDEWAAMLEEAPKAKPPAAHEPFGAFVGAPPHTRANSSAPSLDPFGAFECAPATPVQATPPATAPAMAPAMAPALAPAPATSAALLPRIGRASTESAIADAFSAFASAPVQPPPARGASPPAAPSAFATAPAAMPSMPPATGGAPFRMALGSEFIDLPAVMAARRAPCMAGPRRAPVPNMPMFGAVRAA